jgi:hypothetical protein
LAFVTRLRSAAARGAALVAVLTVAPAAAAQATTWAVTTTADPSGPGCVGNEPCSIRQALQVAAPGDTIVIPANGSHYLLIHGELTVENPVSIIGGGEAATVIDAGGSSRVMLVSAPAGTTTSISNLTLTGGSVESSGPVEGGGGLLLESSSVALTGVAVSGNSVAINPASGEDGGGGILDLSSGPLTLSTTSVDDNSLSVSDPSGGTDGGGGIYAAPGAQLAVTGSTIAANTASISAAGGSSGGGGIYDASAASTYVNDTVSANSLSVSQGASNGGGAIFHEGAPGEISDTTIHQNSANAAGAGIFDNAGAYTVKNTIVAQGASGCAGPAGIVSAGFNLDGGSTCELTTSSDLPNTDPMLGPLANNGGSTLTQALTPASPAIDAGSCSDASGNPVPTDERGVARPQPAGGSCDIGAFEYEPASPKPLIVSGFRPVVLSSTRAMFAGLVNPGGPRTSWWFEYGLDPRYRSGGQYEHSTRPTPIAGGYAPARASAVVSGLVPAALYHVRLVVTNSAGTMVGPDQTFVTATDRRPPPPPQLNRYVNAVPRSGLVRVLIGRSFVPLTEPRRLPVGTEFDARRGTVLVTGAAVHGVVSGTFNGAVFRLGQPSSGPNAGVVTATLADGAFMGVPGYGVCRGRNARVLQTLHASVNGRFRVSGRFSAGTAGAGQWATSDRCDGTLTAVHRGAVPVANLRRHTTFTVRAGGSYLVRR